VTSGDQARAAGFLVNGDLILRRTVISAKIRFIGVSKVNFILVFDRKIIGEFAVSLNLRPFTAISDVGNSEPRLESPSFLDLSDLRRFPGNPFVFLQGKVRSMSLWKSVGRSMLSKASRRKVKSYLAMSAYLQRMPLKTPLSREIIRLECLKSDKPVEALRNFPELEMSAWLGLETLAYRMVQHYRPKVIVELGTHMGLSALAMGLALRNLGEGGQLFAIDSWEGDPQAGLYSDAVYQTFLKRREELQLESTIVPLKMYFDEARDKVATPIDLLHIDGLHTWEAVNHDFETFAPLVRPGGLIIFHDIYTHFEDLRRFWDGISRSFESHTVPYSNGLGIIRTKV
jgi:predicted O-methyltransferase YrrM